MLAAFVSVGARAFDVTLNNIEGEKTGFELNRSPEELRRSMTRRLEAAAELQNNFIIRPRSTFARIVQLDDLDAAKVDSVAPFAFMTFRTSPGNFQAWLAVRDTPDEEKAARDLDSRLRKGAGADLTASGATRIAGSLNFKTKYAPDFPRVELRQVKEGHTVSLAELDAAGLIAPPAVPASPRAPLNRVSRGGRSRRVWPDYERCLKGAPTGTSGNPKRSAADFVWCRTAYEWGWSREAVAGQLMEVSTKAQENGEAYAIQTANRAADSVDRAPYRQKSTPRPS